MPSHRWQILGLVLVAALIGFLAVRQVRAESKRLRYTAVPLPARTPPTVRAWATLLAYLFPTVSLAAFAAWASGAYRDTLVDLELGVLTYGLALGVAAALLAIGLAFWQGRGRVVALGSVFYILLLGGFLFAVFSHLPVH